MRTGIILVIIGVFIGLSVLPICESLNVKKESVSNDLKTDFMKTYSVKTIYVDDDSECPGNGTLEWPYCKIQYAIDNASEDDTIFVFNGTYIENVEIDKTINLKGEDKETAIIDGNLLGDVVYVTADRVSIGGFTIKKSGSQKYWAGIKICSNYNTISDNKIGPENAFGISIENASNNIIENNYILDSSSDGIHLGVSDNNTINSNTIKSNNLDGIWLNKSSNTDIFNNIIEYNGQSGIHIGDFSHDTRIMLKNKISMNPFGILITKNSHSNNIVNNEITGSIRSGIKLSYARYTVISENHIEDCGISINLEFSTNNDMTKNNLMALRVGYYIKNARMVSSDSSTNDWKSNYWSDHPYESPVKRILIWYPNRIIFIGLDVDRDPQAMPYDYT